MNANTELPESRAPAEKSREVLRVPAQALPQRRRRMPSVLYHGTRTSLTALRPSASGTYGAGIYLTGSAAVAAQYAADAPGDGDARVLKVAVRVFDPYRFAAPPADDEATAVTLIHRLLSGAAATSALRAHERFRLGSELADALAVLGHDGLIVSLPGEPAEYVAFHAHQVRIVGG